MINFRVHDSSAMIAQLRHVDIEVFEDERIHPTVDLPGSKIQREIPSSVESHNRNFSFYSALPTVMPRHVIGEFLFIESRYSFCRSEAWFDIYSTGILFPESNLDKLRASAISKTQSQH